MQRNYVRGLLICLVPCVLAAIFAVQIDKYRLGIDLAGGTILVYEINLERTKQLNDARKASDGSAPQRSAAEGLSNEDMLKLATQIKRRIDPADLKNVTVRPLGNTRLEIILPTSGASRGRTNLTSEEIEEVKRLVSQMGVLEFRILANTADDETGIQRAKSIIDNAAPEEVERWAVRGIPPPAPEEKFGVKAAGEQNVDVRYAWVELGREERASLGLSNAYAEQPAGANKRWLYPEAARTRNKTFTHTSSSDKSDKSSTAIYFSREVKNPETLEKEARDKARLEAEGNGDKFDPKKIEYYVLTRVSDADNVRVEGDISLTASAEMDPGSGNLHVAFRFNAAGGREFGRMTERNKPSGSVIRVLAIMLDDRMMSTATINSVITTSGQISGNFDKKHVDEIVQILRNGALNAQLREKPVSENTIGPTLGADTIRKGTLAVGAAFAVVLVFMVIYYRFAGFVACVALLANLLLTVGFMVAVHAAFTLPGLAGVVLMLGMAVDANVLIYERLREERNKGANLATAIRNGYDRAFYTIIDTHLTSIFTAIVLYYFGNDQLKGFAISLTVGLIISLFTSLYMTRLMFDFWLHKKWLTELKMMRLFERPSFNPMKYRFHFFTLTSILTLAGLGLFLARGNDVLNVDFRGGTVYGGRLKDGEERALTATDKPGFRELLGEQNQADRLKVESVRWTNRPSSGDFAAAGTFNYEITYADKTKSTVSLTEKPAGATEQEMEDDVKKRASHLPDSSVEQIFLSDESYPQGKSRYFTIRTTERQRDLVQVTLDRLLTDKSGPLMNKTTMTVGPVAGPVVELTFDNHTSPNYVKDLLHREFQNESALEGDAPFALLGVGDGKDGRFTTMTLDVSKNPKFGAIAKAQMGAAAGGPAGAAIAGSAAAGSVARELADPAAAAQFESLKKITAKTAAEFGTRPVPERLEVFDSTLAKETQSRAFLAIVVSWIAILGYLWFRFGNWTFGLAAVLCLIHDLCFTLGAIALCHYLFAVPGMSVLGVEDYKIDLAAVAALLTLVGYSVNEIIVNFARIREVRGKNPLLTPQTINDSVNQTLSRTILTSMTVLLVSLVLYIFGGEGVHLFAFVMISGVLISTYSSIFVASPLLLFLGEGRTTSEVHAGPETTESTEKEEEEVVEG